MEDPNEFGHFDVVSDDSDHHFLGSKKGKCFTDLKSRVYMTIMREWKILEKNLPESIHVRVYERRIDLMRAVIVGAADTPYHDGLFFFDILFPFDYPIRPPKLHYHSFGVRVNPNLYEDGTVCLSLLNTWHGKTSEKWDPCESTMLQVLLSIQALVLNEQPFFNEPGTVPSESSSKKSRDYNERAFTCTCYTSYHLLQKPPRNFETFVSAHFRERASQILAACNEYMNGRVRVGYYSSRLHSSSSSSSSTVEVSRDFKKQVMKLYPLLVQVFQRTGAALDGLAVPENPSMQWEQPYYLIFVSLFLLFAADEMIGFDPLFLLTERCFFGGFGRKLGGGRKQKQRASKGSNPKP